MYKILAIFRLLAFALATIILIGFVLTANLLLGTNMPRSLAMRKRWSKVVTRLLGLHISYSGEIPKEPGLIICNHRSYLDLVPVFNRLLVFPVGKIQVSSWPLIGLGARHTGVLFVDREDARQRRTIVDLMKEKMEEGFFVLNYAEGTTHKQPVTIDFKKGAFYLAAENDFPLYPVALDFKNTDDAWVGDDTFIRHFLECFAKPRTDMKINFGEPLYGSDVNELLLQTKNRIDDQLLRFRNEWSADDKSKSNT